VNRQLSFMILCKYFSSPRVRSASALLLGAALVSTTIRVEAGPQPAAAPGASVNSPASAPAEVAMAKSVFIMPTAPREGKDPFFPRSTRPYTTRVISTNTAPVAIIADFRLDGISGPPEHRLAIINYKTFEVGEKADVNTNAGRMNVHCLEIGADSVVIIVGGTERRVLRLRGGSVAVSHS
jgi:hypothetical protein